MMYGIIVQLIGIVIYSIFQVDFLVRFHYDRPVRSQKSMLEGTRSRRLKLDRNILQMLAAMSFATMWILIR